MNDYRNTYKTCIILPFKTTFTIERLARIYGVEIVKLHEMLRSIVLDSKFNFIFLEIGVHKAFGTQLKFMLSFHPQKMGKFNKL